VKVTAGDATAAIATNIAAAINANLDLPVTASVVGSTVTLLFRHKGLTGNTYDIRHSFRSDSESLPAGVTLTITAMSGGTTAPVLTNLIAAMSNIWFQIWSHPYTDATSLTAIEAELASRNGPTRSIDGQAITATAGTFSAHTTLGGGRNSQFSQIWAQPGSSTLTPPMEFAAEVAAVEALAASADPARPMTTLTARAHDRAGGNRAVLDGRAKPDAVRRHLDDDPHGERQRRARAGDHDVPGQPERRRRHVLPGRDDPAHADVSPLFVPQPHADALSRATSWRTTRRASDRARPS
jgi:phage tail sheath gpL-like